MVCRVLSVTPDEPRKERVEAAVATLRDGGIVGLPTETFYGLAADCGNAEAVARVNALKGKPPGSPVLLLAANREQAERVAAAPPARFAALCDRFWPGPLTLVVPASPELPHAVTGGRGTVGVRVPGLVLPRRLAAALGRPITGVSANRHGEPPSRTAAEVVRGLPEGLDLILDGGAAPGGAPSTVLDLSVEPARILREGRVPRSALAAFVPELRDG